MSEYPPGSWGYEADQLDEKLADLEKNGHIIVRHWARAKRRKFQAFREGERRRIPERLHRAGWITAAQRAAMEEADHECD